MSSDKKRAVTHDGDIVKIDGKSAAHGIHGPRRLLGGRPRHRAAGPACLPRRPGLRRPQGAPQSRPKNLRAYAPSGELLWEAEQPEAQDHYYLIESREPLVASPSRPTAATSTSRAAASSPRHEAEVIAQAISGITSIETAVTMTIDGEVHAPAGADHLLHREPPGAEHDGVRRRADRQHEAAGRRERRPAPRAAAPDSPRPPRSRRGSA